MKKYLFRFLLVWLALGLALPVRAQENQEDIVALTRDIGYSAAPDLAPKASMVINAENGQILWEQGATQVSDPGSLTKLMVAYLVMEAIEVEDLSLDQPVHVRQEDQAISWIPLVSNYAMMEGETYTVSELLSAMLVASSNTATLMLAREVEENPGAFVDRMNRKAQELGMKRTVFQNATGMEAAHFGGLYKPEGYDVHLNNQSTAKDMAILSYQLIRRFPSILSTTNQDQVVFKEGTEQERRFQTVNLSLAGAGLGIEGVNGLHSGLGEHKGYNTVVTAMRGKTRLIVVVLGNEYWWTNGRFYRHYFANALLKHIFSTHTRRVVAPSGTYHIDGQTIYTDEDLYGLATKGQELEVGTEGQNLILVNTLDKGVGVPLVTAPVLAPSLSVLKERPFRLNLHSLWRLSPYLLLVVVGCMEVLRRLRVKKRRRPQNIEETPDL